jgi:type II secretory pathway component PulF
MNSYLQISFWRFGAKEQALFAKRLSFLVQAGIPLLECLYIMRAQAKGAQRIKMYDALVGDVERGQYLSTSLEKIGQVSGLAVHLVRVGEHSGTLSENLSYLADELHKRHELRRKVLSALVYPAFITAATLGLVALLTAYIFPKLMPVFAGLHAELPLSTKMLIATSSYLRSWGLLTLLACLAIGCAIAFARARSERVREWGDQALLRMPFAGRMARAYNQAGVCRTLGLLLKAGVSVPIAMSIMAQSTHNRVYRAAYARAAATLPAGERLSQALARESRLFPDLMSHMAGIGEATGNLSGTLLYLAGAYESEVDELAKNLSSSMEPALMLVMGSIVGFVAVSVITPIYGITQHLSPR